jgi:hypothetical protein
MAVGAAMLVLGLIAQTWWGLIGLVPIITCAIGYCPLYRVLGWSTAETPKKASWSKRRS